MITRKSFGEMWVIFFSFFDSLNNISAWFLGEIGGPGPPTKWILFSALFLRINLMMNSLKSLAEIGLQVVNSPLPKTKKLLPFFTLSICPERLLKKAVGLIISYSRPEFCKRCSKANFAF